MANGHAGAGSLPIGNTAFIDDVLESDQGYARGPERALLSALLFDGIQAFMNYACAQSDTARARYREAFLWVNTRGSDYIFSFDNVCEALGVDAEYFRYGLANATNSQTFEWKRGKTQLLSVALLR